MKTLLSTIALAALLAGAPLLTGCGGDAPSTENAATMYACPMHPEVTGKQGDDCSKCGMPLEPMKMDDAHEHTYACPMHPEVTGKKGDTCSKCGMPLEHKDVTSDAAAASYRMDFRMEPAQPEMNKPVKLVFTPRLVGQENQPVALDVVHEKKLHLIITSSDLRVFDHIHPEYQADGSYVVEHRFPEGGPFLLFADYKPTGGDHQMTRLEANVEGPVLPPSEIKAEQRMGKADGYEMTIDAKAAFATGSLQHFLATVTKGGKPVDANVFENYLGEKAHVVIIGAKDKDYLHVHPVVENGAFDLHATFPTPGFYKGWFQFQTGGKLHVIEFVLNVEQGEAGDGHADHDHASSEEGTHAH